MDVHVAVENKITTQTSLNIIMNCIALSPSLKKLPNSLSIYIIYTQVAIERPYLEKKECIYLENRKGKRIIIQALNCISKAGPTLLPPLNKTQTRKKHTSVEDDRSQHHLHQIPIMGMAHLKMIQLCNSAHNNLERSRGRDMKLVT